MWDAYSGDYGPNFSGHAMAMGTYIVDHPLFGWQAYGGNVISESSSPIIRVQIRDSVRRRLYIAPLGSLLTLDSGAFSMAEYNPQALSLNVTIIPAPENSSGAPAPKGRLTLQQKAVIPGVGPLRIITPRSTDSDAGAFNIPFVNGQGTIVLLA